MGAVKVIALLAIASFYTMNMGASGIGISFSPAYGGKIISRRKAVLLFTISVFLGAILIGEKVSRTIRSKIVSQSYMTVDTVIIILLSCCLSLFIANIIKIPQSTSIVTVFSLAGVGLYFRSLNVKTITVLLITWGVFLLMTYFITYFVARRLYPPQARNLWIYEKVFTHEKKLRMFVLLTSIYSAFSIGTNNVANVVGPITGAGILDSYTGFLVFSPFFGIGSLLFGGKILNTVGKEIVPLGILTASIISLVVSSSIVLSSLLGLPAPYAQFLTVAVLAVNTVKRETYHADILRHPITSKIIKTWLTTPILSLVVTYTLLLMKGA